MLFNVLASCASLSRRASSVSTARRDVADGGDDLRAVVGVRGAEADLGRELAAVGAPAPHAAVDAQQQLPGILEVLNPFAHAARPHPLRHQQLD